MPVVPVAAALVIAAAVTVRILYLGSQSYWNDEIFSVNQARQDLSGVFAVGATEVHTPLYAVLLHTWIGLGRSTVTTWTHALSGLFGLLATAATWSALRRTGLTSRARWVAVAVTASSGFGIVYAQETRPYGLALLGATGVTAATAGAIAALLDRRRPRWHWWLLWGLAAATAHLLGAVLVGIAAVVLAATALAVRRPWQALAAAAVVVPALAPQVGWLALHGRNQPGFAGGTRWIDAPGPKDVGHLLTSVFASGELTTTTGGYVWASGAGTGVVSALFVAALLLRFLTAVPARPPQGSPAGTAHESEQGEVREQTHEELHGAATKAAVPPAGPVTEQAAECAAESAAGRATESAAGRAAESAAESATESAGQSTVERAPGKTAQQAAEPDGDDAQRAAPPLFAAGAALDGVLGLMLLLLAALTVAVTYLVAQDVHIWTLRNMIVVVPALSWASAWILCALPRPGAAKDVAAVAVLTAAAAALVPITADLGRPYKTDLRSAIGYLARMRSEHPTATFSFFGPGPVNSLVAADRDPADPELLAIFDRVDPHPRPDWAINRLHRLQGPQAVFFYTGPTGARDDEVTERILGQLRDPSCARVPLHGVVLVSCEDGDLRAGPV